MSERCRMSTESMTGPGPTDRPTRSASVAEQLRSAILAGTFQPGERLREVSLGEQLHVSRTPVRLALQALAGDGLLEYVPNRGYSVRAFDRVTILQAFEVRAALEGLAARFTAERGLDGAEQAGLERILAEGDALLQAGSMPEASRPAYTRINAAFHEALHRASRNRMIGEMLRISQQVPLSSYRQVVAFEHGLVRRRHDDHHRIFEAILLRDAGRADGLMRDHVGSIRAAFLGGGAA